MNDKIELLFRDMTKAFSCFEKDYSTGIIAGCNIVFINIVGDSIQSWSWNGKIFEPGLDVSDCLVRSQSE